MLKQQANHRLIGSWEILPNAKAPLSNDYGKIMKLDWKVEL